MKNAQPAPAQCLIEHYSGTLRVQFSIGSNTWDYTARFPRGRGHVAPFRDNRRRDT
jgi:hypothetical protein